MAPNDRDSFYLRVRIGMTGPEKQKLDKILKFIDGGQGKEAYELLKEVLVQNPENLDAWNLLLRVAPTEKEREFARFRLLFFYFVWRLLGVIQHLSRELFYPISREFPLFFSGSNPQ